MMRITAYLSIFFLSSFRMFGGDETRSFRIYANNNVTGAYIQTYDDKYTGSGWVSGFTNYYNRAVIEFGLDEELHNYLTLTKKYIAVFDMDLTDVNGVKTSYANQQIEISFNPNEQTTYRDKAQIIIEGIYKVKVYKIRFYDCPANVTCSNVYTGPDLYLQAEVTTTRYYDFTFQSTFAGTSEVSHTLLSSDQDLEVRWAFVKGAEEYELDYTYVDNYSGSSLLYNLEKSATRITTSRNSYKIPLIYGQGYIIYRIRPVGRTASGERVEGAWIGSSNGAANNATFNQAINMSNLNAVSFVSDEMNWTGEKTFAENGKTNTSINYIDALGKNRQSIFRLNTDNKSNIISTLYDYYGRPSINILPSPITGKSLNYRFSLNRYQAGTNPSIEFDKSTFDLVNQTDPCAPLQFPVDPVNSTGAAKYYSSSNTDKQKFQGYIPDAMGYPYTLIKFKQDGLNRVKTQTLPGNSHILGSTREKRYFYTKPSQIELDVLFGSEAPRATRSYKDVVIDAHGEIINTYLDENGRILASGVVGDCPTNLDPIGARTSVPVTDHLAVVPNNLRDTSEKCTEVNTDIFIQVDNTNNDFLYKTTLATFADTCMQPDVCFSCIYELQILIKDECGQQIYFYDNNLGLIAGSPSVGIAAPFGAVTCVNGGAYIQIMGANVNTPLTLAFPKAGNYSIYKKLCLSETPIEDYADAFIAMQNCKTPCHFVDSLMNATDFTSCDGITCTECNNRLLNYKSSNTDPNDPNYNKIDEDGFPINQNFNGPVNPTLPPQKLSELYERCAKLCGPASSCEKYEWMLMADFYPGLGQYAALNHTDPNSIFTTGNSLFNGVTWVNPPSQYLSLSGSADQVKINGVNYTPESLTESEFIQNFRMNWAKSFLPLHPEYCKLSFYCTVLSTSLDYDDEMKKVSHYDYACNNAGYLFPISSNLSQYGVTAIPNCGSSMTDPIISLVNDPLYGTAVNNFINQLMNNCDGNSNLNIYDYIATNVGGSFGQNYCINDAMWLQFRELYLAKKQILYIDMYNAYVASLQPNNCGTTPAGYIAHMPDPQTHLNNMLGSQGYTNYYNAASTGNASAASALNSAYITANTPTQVECDSACSSYRSLWHSNLNTGCTGYGQASTNTKIDILNALQGVCKSGCDIINPDGASNGSGYSTSINGATVLTTFQSVLNYFSINCNAGIITMPGPQISQNTHPPGATLNSCKCDVLLAVAAAFQTSLTNNSLPPGITYEWQAFQDTYGYDLKEYNTLKCACNTATATDVTWGYQPGNWSQTQETALTTTLLTNPKLKCESCITCTDVVTVINGLGYSQGTYPDVLAAIKADSTKTYASLAVLNQQFGPNSMSFYSDLYYDCISFTTSGTFSNTLNQEGIELYNYLKQLVKNKSLTTNNRPLSICTDDKYYLSGIYSETLPTINPLTYSVFPANNTAATPIHLAIVDPSTTPPTTVLSISLANPATSVNWDNLINLSNFSAYCPAIISGPVYTFAVIATDNTSNTITLTGTITNQAFPLAQLSPGSNPLPQNCGPKIRKVNTCAITLLNNALVQGRVLFANYQADLRKKFIIKYKNYCFNSINETFDRYYNHEKDRNVTLYYYDLAGNNYRTVPPNGVDQLSLTQNLTTTTYPNHSSSLNGVDQHFVTARRYNTNNLLATETTIDGGQTGYAYDAFGRLCATQNSKQVAASPNQRLSYIYYDKNDRIVETGEGDTKVNSPGVFAVGDEGAEMSDASYYLNVSPNKREIVRTYYDELPANISAFASVYFTVPDHQPINLRNKVSCIQYEDDANVTSGEYNNAIFYSYDEHGNVQWIVTENASLPDELCGSAPHYNMRFKKVSYEYDLLSGKMLNTTYQKDEDDQFIHKFFYDDDNRLHEVFSSRDKINWDRDAKYFYYEHGPLARVERGDKKVQGTDFYYTIHGWLKGINSDQMSIDTDLGKDGQNGTNYLSNYSDVHKYFGKDAMALTLNYYRNSVSANDYTAVKTFAGTDLNPQASLSNLINPTGTPPFYLHTGAGAGDGPNLYNGNISSMVTGLINKTPGLAGVALNAPFPQLSAYRYDMLQRVTSQKTFRDISNNTWNTPTSSNFDDSYKMTFGYDLNGNITSLLRNGPDPSWSGSPNLTMDNLAYLYPSVSNGGFNANKLYMVTDGINFTNYPEDVDGPTSSSTYGGLGNDRFGYDESGNLVEDKGEYIAQIEYTYDNKVKKITRDAAAMQAAGIPPKSDLEYVYDGLRNRIEKIEKPRDPGFQLTTNTEWKHTYYQRDATGNSMAVYHRESRNMGSFYTDEINLEEHHLYGDKRLALTRPVNNYAIWNYDFNVLGQCLPGSFCTRAPVNGGTQGNTGGVYGQGTDAATTPAIGTYAARNLGFKEFELSNHLGNVISTVSDRKIAQIGYSGSCLCSNPMSNTTGFTGQNVSFSTSNGWLVITQTPNQAVYDVTAQVCSSVPAGNYVIEFDFDPGNYSGQVPLWPVNYNTSNSTWNVQGGYTQFTGYPPPGAHYTFTFTQPAQYNNMPVYLWFVLASGATSSIYIKLDNLSICPVSNPPTVGTYTADPLMNSDYYAGGMPMYGRNWKVADYRYAYQGSETDDEISGEGNSITTFYREGDTRLLRWGGVDPKASEQPYQSPYSYMDGNPIKLNDPRGDCPWCLAWADAVVDVGFMVYDAGVLIHEKATTGKTSAANWAALIADGASIAVPMSVGAGAVVRAAMKAADKAADAARLQKQTSRTTESKVEVNSNAGTYYRYVGDKEAKTIKKTGKIPNIDEKGNPKNIYITDRKYETAGKAKSHNQLPNKPTHRVEIDPKNVSDQTPFKRIDPSDNPQWGVGKGRESTTPNPIKVDPKKVTPLK
jgi:YD repeat-containing protein